MSNHRLSQTVKDDWELTQNQIKSLDRMLAELTGETITALKKRALRGNLNAQKQLNQLHKSHPGIITEYEQLLTHVSKLEEQYGLAQAFLDELLEGLDDTETDLLQEPLEGAK